MLNLQKRPPLGYIKCLALRKNTTIDIELAVEAAAENNMNTIEIEDKLGITFCDRIPLVIERGLGTSVWDSDDTLYLDFTAGWGVTCLGHSHPVITDALITQSAKIMQSPNSGFTYSPARATALLELNKVLPQNMAKSYFVNSGAEANDAAIKLARKISGRSKIISTLNSFHGRTFNTLMVSTDKHNGERYLPVTDNTFFVEFGNIAAIEKLIDSSIAAIILEPIQGEGGVRVPPDDYISKVSDLCKRHGAYLIIDEIQTGFCRTGKFFAIEHSSKTIEADFMTIGKGLAGGFPIAAFAVSKALSGFIEKGDHGGTYCGNPLGCAVSTAVVSHLIENKFHEQSARKGDFLGAKLYELKDKYSGLIKGVRGCGLLWAIELDDQSQVTRLTDLAMLNGLLVIPTRNSVVRLIPPLVVTEHELSQGISSLDLSLQELYLELFSH